MRHTIDCLESPIRNVQMNKILSCNFYDVAWPQHPMLNWKPTNATKRHRRPAENGLDFQSRSFVKNKNIVVIFRVRNENRSIGRKSFWLCASLKFNLMENRNIIAIVHTLSCGQSGVRHHFDVGNVCCAFSTQNNTSLLCANKRTNRDDLVLIESRKWRLEKINYSHFNSYTHQVPDVDMPKQEDDDDEDWKQ